MNNILYQNIQLRDGIAVIYPEIENRGIRGKAGLDGGRKADKRDENLARSASDYRGTLSKKAIRNIKEKVTALVQGKMASQRKKKKTTDPRRCFTFVTLTLSDDQKHTDNFIKRHLLGWFITEMNRKYFLKNYLWKAEKQQNGRIHFHIIMDLSIHWRKVRDLWNQIQSYHGYLDNYQKKTIDRYKGGFFFRSDWKIKKNGKMVTKPYQEQLNYYIEQKRRNFKDANSTDIHRLDKVKDIGSYITKEIAKNKQGGVGGRLWGCADNLDKAKYFADVIEGSDYEDFYAYILNEGFKFYDEDFCTVVSLRNIKVPEELCCRMERHYSQFLN